MEVAEHMPGAKHAGLGVRRNHDSLLRNFDWLRSFLRADQVRELDIWKQSRCWWLRGS